MPDACTAFSWAHLGENLGLVSWGHIFLTEIRHWKVLGW